MSLNKLIVSIALVGTLIFSVFAATITQAHPWETAEPNIALSD